MTIALRFAQSWNFGPEPADIQPVSALADAMLARWGRAGGSSGGGDGGGWQDVSDAAAPHEAAVLRLAITKAADRLDWRPLWSFAETIARTADWYREVGTRARSARAACEADLAAFCAAAVQRGAAFAA